MGSTCGHHGGVSTKSFLHSWTGLFYPQRIRSVEEITTRIASRACLNAPTGSSAQCNIHKIFEAPEYISTERENNKRDNYNTLKGNHREEKLRRVSC